MPEEPTLQLNPRKGVTYYVVAGILSGLSRLLFRPKVTGRENIPLSGPVLALHLSAQGVLHGQGRTL